MFKKRNHGSVLTHRTFVGILVLWTFLMWAFFGLMGFFGLAHVGQGQVLWVWPN